ncbi:hypothetical protein E2320_019626 [Naja naja]|nr:hypothetical protein E2320_019626 [Naja naja]
MPKVLYLIGKCIGEDAKYEGIRLLFDGLQQPVLNKQLTYVLLDIGIQELFPELNGIETFTTSRASATATLLADFLSRNGGETQFLEKYCLIYELYNELYKNNANRSENLERRQNENYFLKMMTVEGVYDYLMYIGKKLLTVTEMSRVVFHIPDWLHHILMGGRILFKNTLEKYIDNYLQYKLEQLFQEHRLVSLITLLRDAVFCENSQPRSLQDKHKRAKQTFEEMMKYIPGSVFMWHDLSRREAV